LCILPLAIIFKSGIIFTELERVKQKTKKEKRGKKMMNTNNNLLTFRIANKYNGTVKHIKGINVWEAMKNNGCDCKEWILVAIN